MELHLKGKVAIVTGGSKGIGKGIAEALLKEGATVVITARNADELEDTAAMFRLQGMDVLAIVADMTKEADLQRLVTTTVQKLGHIDILVNNAGGLDVFGPLDTIDMNQWRQVFELNLFGVVALTQLVIPHLKKQGGGRIINISSETAEQPDPDMGHYSAAKAALNNYTKTLSRNYGKDNILVNTVSPAFIQTPLLDEMLEGISKAKNISIPEAANAFLKENRPYQVMGRPGTPEEAGSLVAFLASEQAAFITGSLFRIDGGSVGTV